MNKANSLSDLNRRKLELEYKLRKLELTQGENHSLLNEINPKGKSLSSTFIKNDRQELQRLIEYNKEDQVNLKQELVDINRKFSHQEKTQKQRAGFLFITIVLFLALTGSVLLLYSQKGTLTGMAVLNSQEMGINNLSEVDNHLNDSLTAAELLDAEHFPSPESLDLINSNSVTLDWDGKTINYSSVSRSKIIITADILADKPEDKYADPIEDKKFEKKNVSFFDSKANIKWIGEINSSYNLSTLISAIKTKNNEIYVDSNSYPELNQPAEVTFHTNCLGSPSLAWNGKYIPDMSLKETKGKNGLCDYFFIAPYFSSWTLFNNTFNGTGSNFTNYTLYSGALGLDTWEIRHFWFADNLTSQNVRVVDSSYFNQSAIVNTYHTSNLDQNHNAWTGECLKFNRTDVNYILVPAINLTNVTLIVKYNTTDTSAIYKGLISNRDGEKGISLSLNANNLYCGGGNGSVSSYNYARTTASATSNGSTYCAGCRFNGTTYTIFLNGAEAGTPTKSVYLTANTQNSIGILATSGSFANPYTGNIIKVAIFNRSMTATESQSFCDDTLVDYSENVLGYNMNLSNGNIAVDSSGNNRNGNLTNYKRPVWSNSTSSGEYYFDGKNDEIRIPNSADLLLKNWTVFTRINRSSLGGMMVTAKSGSQIMYLTSANKMYSYSTQSPYPTSTTSILDNRTYDLAVTYDQTNLSIYVNGTLEDSKACAISNCTINNTAVWYVGNSQGAGYFYNGTIYDFKIFNKAFTASQVLELSQKLDTEFKYYPCGIYESEIFNQTINNSQFFTNLWIEVNGTTNDVTPDSSSWQGRAGNCSIITSLDWTNSSGGGGGAGFTNANFTLTGDCFQFRTSSCKYNATSVPLIYNYTIGLSTILKANISGITACQDINVSGTYVLLNDLIGVSSGTYLSTPYCIQISNSDVILSGNGYSLLGNISNNSAYGIVVNNKSNIEVKDMGISYYKSGLAIYNDFSTIPITNISVYNVTFSNISVVSNIVSWKNYSTAIISYDANNLNISNNTILNSDRGILIQSNNYNNTLSGNRINATYEGLHIVNPLNLTMENNDIIISSSGYTYILREYNFYTDGVFNSHTINGNTCNLGARKLYYLRNLSNQVGSYSDACGIWIIDSSNLTLENISIPNSGSTFIFENDSNITLNNISVNIAYENLQLHNASDFVVSNWVGNAIYDYGFAMVNIKNARFTNITFTGLNHDAFITDETGQNVAITNLNITNLTTSSLAFCSNTSNFSIDGAYYNSGINAASYYLIGISNCQNSSFSNILAENSRILSGLYAYGNSNNLTFQNITIRNTTFYSTNKAIYLTSVSNIFLNNISIQCNKTSSTYGLYLSSTSGISIMNLSLDSFTYGMFTSTPDALTIKDLNIVNTDYGLYGFSGLNLSVTAGINIINATQTAVNGLGMQINDTIFLHNASLYGLESTSTVLLGGEIILTGDYYFNVSVLNYTGNDLNFDYFTDNDSVIRPVLHYFNDTTISGKAINPSGLYIDNNYTMVSLNSSQLPELNKTARLTFKISQCPTHAIYLSNFTSNITELYNSGQIMSSINMTCNASAGYVYFNVSYFGTWGTKNTIPSPPTLSLIADGGTTTNRTPTFIWNNATDADGDILTYNILADDNSAFNNPEINISNIAETATNTSYTAETELSVDTVYYWKVRAFDGIEYGNYSGVFNFTLQSYLAISILREAVNFGNATISQQINTSNGDPLPFWAENAGNIVANVTLTATPLFTSVDYPSLNYQFRAEANESGAFNTTSSTMNWTNMSNVSTVPQIIKLDWHDYKDDFLLGLNLLVPPDEGGGEKNSTVTFTIT